MIGGRNKNGSTDFFQDGLHKKKPSLFSLLPSSVQENFAVLVSLAVAIGGVLIFYASSVIIHVVFTDDPAKIPTDPRFQARLTMPLGPTKIYAPGSDKILTRLEVKVKNVGQGEALNVWVDTEVDGAPASMIGPLRIQSGADANYYVEGPVEISKSSSIKITAVCWNCPRTPGQTPDIQEILAWRASEEQKHGIPVK